MIFSNKIFKIVNGENVSLYPENEESLILYINDKILKKYRISTISNRNCVFIRSYNYKKIIQINNEKLGIASNGYITIETEENI